MPTTDSWVLFEDARAADGRGTRIYLGMAGAARCTGADAPDGGLGLVAFLRQIERWHRDGRQVVLALDYEFGNLLERGTAPAPAGRTCAEAFAFERFETCVPGDLAAKTGRAATRAAPAGVAALRPAIDAGEYRRRFERVQQYIRDGHTYQINLTFPLQFEWFGDPLDLYLRLRDRQRVSYGAFLRLPGRTLLSLSPELFIRCAGGRIETRPMKGTRPRTGDPGADRRAGQAMREDPKSRAENLMIVDLLRNDLGRVCETGSIRVERLFDIETFDTVLQMTSTISGRLAAGAGLGEVLRALFPCGSVTGAPKHRSRQIIDEIEARPRGIYTGSIGTLDPDGTLLLNVAIRTLELADGGRGRLGIGGGIVADSACEDEWDECFVKARFLTGADPGFGLIETMGATIRAGGGAAIAAPDDAIALWPRHAARLDASAAHFGFGFDPQRIAGELLAYLRRLPEGRHRLRAVLARSGELQLSSQELAAPGAAGALPRVGIAPQPVHSAAWHQSHKTTWRPQYDPALERAGHDGLWDLLFFNERDELVEGARSTVVLQLDGTLATPPLASGALPGVYRAHLLADASSQVVERVLSRSDLRRARRVYLCNAVRGLFEVRLEDDQPAAAGAGGPAISDSAA